MNLEGDMDFFFKKGLKMYMVINNGKFILSLWNFTTAFRFIIAIQKVFNSQNTRTLVFRGLNSGILALFVLLDVEIYILYKYCKLFWMSFKYLRKLDFYCRLNYGFNINNYGRFNTFITIMQFSKVF